MFFIPHRGKIGFVDLYGSMNGGNQTASYIDIFATLREASWIKSVVINVDSGGGLATAANSLYFAVSRLSAQKPTIAFISGTGASGAYLVSCACTKIVAIPGAIVGSIAVITSSPVAHELLDNVGIGFSVTKSGHLKDTGAFYREMTDEEKAKEQSMVNSFHDYFVGIVAKGRNMDEEAVRNIATGEVFLAETAKELGLVDELGDVEDVLDLAAQMGNVKKRTAHMAPRRSLMQRLFSRFGASVTEQLLAEMHGSLTERRIFYSGPPHPPFRL